MYIHFQYTQGGTITTIELGQVMRTFGYTPSEGDLQVSPYFAVFFLSTYLHNKLHVFVCIAYLLARLVGSLIELVSLTC